MDFGAKFLVTLCLSDPQNFSIKKVIFYPNFLEISRKHSPEGK